MIKALKATCVAGIVTADSLPVSGATVLSEGLGSSSGLALIQDGDVYYLTKTSPDLKSALDQISTALSQIASALAALDAKPVGGVGSAPAPAVAANVAAVSAAQSAIAALKGMLK